MDRRQRDRGHHVRLQPGRYARGSAGRLGLTIGVENVEGSAGDQIAPTLPETPPTQDLRATSIPGAPGGTFTYSFGVRGIELGIGLVRTDLTTPLVRGTTIDVDAIQITN